MIELIEKIPGVKTVLKKLLGTMRITLLEVLEFNQQRTIGIAERGVQKKNSKPNTKQKAFARNVRKHGYSLIRKRLYHS